jgi:4-hydroxy-tetrahydrodipicolinate reductase
VKLAIHGATGRMGLSIVRLARAAGDEIVGGACSPGDPAVGRDLGELAGIGPLGVVASADTASALLGADVVIDFSTASAVPALVATAARQGVRVMSGTTGLDAGAEAALERAAASVAVLWAPNTSLGVQVLAELVEQAVKRLGPAFDVEILELHHRRKIDAPSGTALRLARAARAARSELKELHTRDGDVGARTNEELGVVAVRGGDVIGDHTVFLLGNGERLELTHRASSRELFAQGALAAARFVHGKPPGRYAFKDILA